MNNMYENVKKQAGGKDCRLFAIDYATAISHGVDPSGIELNHLSKCLKEENSIFIHMKVTNSLCCDSFPTNCNIKDDVNSAFVQGVVYWVVHTYTFSTANSWATIKWSPQLWMICSWLSGGSPVLGFDWSNVEYSQFTFGNCFFSSCWVKFIGISESFSPLVTMSNSGIGDAKLDYFLERLVFLVNIWLALLKSMFSKVSWPSLELSLAVLCSIRIHGSGGSKGGSKIECVQSMWKFLGDHAHFC